ncbi:hypothetical protein C490_16406 [Natronobacterium gregoryi SP2]|uniref:Uncharacterized protein n=1 Tax=Natronobacterium gregoryi (strain ATCC 43098 / DSM 3393 / CCM 3738 / CIP 104747 / IAM 13177 / JCM 8860 / NBRC 102187 / NCIMB 2189 / SP2) TaxID=797304 RepID=L9XP45_NATGS|nr:hypothetical protein C490_16406 [Natronobacterium gregoryi SP2]
MDLLCVVDQSVEQRWRRVAEMFAKFVEDELGVRPKGRRPAFRREHDLVVHLFGDQIEQFTTHEQ